MDPRPGPVRSVPNVPPSGPTATDVGPVGDEPEGQDDQEGQPPEPSWSDGAGVEVCDEHTLLVGRPIATLSSAAGIVLEGWLLDHGIDPHRLLPERPVVRDPATRRLSWCELDEAGRPRLRAFHRPGRRDVWPAAYPDLLVDRRSHPGGRGWWFGSE